MPGRLHKTAACLISIKDVFTTHGKILYKEKKELSNGILFILKQPPVSGGCK